MEGGVLAQIETGPTFERDVVYGTGQAKEDVTGVKNEGWILEKAGMERVAQVHVDGGSDTDVLVRLHGGLDVKLVHRIGAGGITRVGLAVADTEDAQPGGEQQQHGDEEPVGTIQVAVHESDAVGKVCNGSPRRAERSASRSSQGYSVVPKHMLCSWPLPHTITTSPAVAI